VGHVRAPIPYVTKSSGRLNADLLNAIYFGESGFETVLSTMLGGLDFAHAFPGAVPPQLLGFCYFFLAGPAIYAKKFPGFVAKTLTVHDPVAGADVPCAGGASYDHSVFTAAANAMNYVSQDDENHIVTVGGAFHSNGIGSLDGSMEAHTRLITPAGGSTPLLYFLKESSLPNPERIHDFAVAELIFEGQTDVTLNEGTVPKYRCQRLRNFNPVPLTVRANGYTVTVPSRSCVTVRRDWDAATRRMKNPRFGKHFWRWETPGDPFMFANYANSRPGGFGDPIAIATTANTPASAIQANNITNAALLHDFILQLSQDGNFCQFINDPTELCDLTAL